MQCIIPNLVFFFHLSFYLFFLLQANVLQNPNCAQKVYLLAYKLNSTNTMNRTIIWNSSLILEHTAVKGFLFIDVLENTSLRLLMVKTGGKYGKFIVLRFFHQNLQKSSVYLDHLTLQKKRLLTQI